MPTPPFPPQAQPPATLATYNFPYNYEDTVAVLVNLPETWYPQLLKELATAAINKKVFKPFGASLQLFLLETRLYKAAVAARTPEGDAAFQTLAAHANADELVTVMQRLLDCPDLNFDDLDDETREAIEEATGLIQRINDYP